MQVCHLWPSATETAHPLDWWITMPTQVRAYLESVYAVSAQPEEYVKYRLHLVTRLEMQQINDWFHNRCACNSSSGLLCLRSKASVRCATACCLSRVWSCSTSTNGSTTGARLGLRVSTEHCCMHHCM